MPKIKLYRLGLYSFPQYEDSLIGDRDVNFKLYNNIDDVPDFPVDAVKFLKDVFLFSKSSIPPNPDLEVTGYFAIHDDESDKDYNAYISTYATRDGKFKRSYAIKKYENGWVDINYSNRKPLNQLEEYLKTL